MKRPKNTEDQSRFILWFTLTILFAFVAISFIPPFSIGDLHIGRVNIFSDFLKFKDSTKVSVTSKELLDTSCLADVSEDIISQIAANNPRNSQTESSQSTTEIQPGDISDNAELFSGKSRRPSRKQIDSTQIGGLEDYSPCSEMTARLASYFNKEKEQRCVHVGFFGDSFIEGDILTCDLRSELQNVYGGQGMGYIPFADPRSGNRPTINQVHSGWTTYSLLRKKKAPEKYSDEFGINGYISIPSAGAKASFSARSGSSIDCSCARILFKNKGAGHMDLVINGTDTLHYDLKISADLQQVSVSGTIHTLEVRLPVCEDFIGYGVEFEGRNGICVDNFALRSHSGLNLVGTSKSINQQFNEIVKLDVIVLEYGLNVMQKKVTDYSFFASKIRNVINYLHLCFPESVIIVMSVGDVGLLKDGKVVTAPSVRPMVASQREAAIDTGVMFWDTFSAMSGEDSMAKMVEKGWAAKDYTHIGFKGGKMLSGKIASSIKEKITINQNAI